MSLKRALLGIAIVAGFFVGYGVSAAVEAYPSGGVYGRGQWRGYFTNTLDQYGTDVLPAFPSYGGNSFPATLDTANEFINFIKFAKLDIDNNGSGDMHERTGAAFIIHTMLNTPVASRNRPPSAAQIAEWEARVRYSESRGWISWNVNYSHTINSYYQGPRGGGATNDDAFYDERGTSRAITFRNASGTVVYALRRQCANPIGNGSITSIPDDLNFTMTGRTVVQGGRTTVFPGQQVVFQHYLRNSGPTATTPTTINWLTQNMPSQATIASGNANTFAVAQEKNVSNETVTVPNNAASGTQICRRVGWDPVNATGTRNGRGNTVCVTVVIPAHLKAAMSVAPPTMNPGDTATFTPVVSSSNNGTPVTVNCTIVRTVYSPSGVATGTSSQPCQTTSGSSDIVVGTGASVTLRTNDYVAPDTIAVGSRVCDVITITRPTESEYFLSPADRTAEACVRIAKTPYVHFSGGDVWAGGGFAAVAPGTCTNNSRITTVTRTRPLTADGSTPGSAVTYAAFALGKITNFGSASMALTTATGTGDNWTFANTNTSQLGHFNSGQHCIPDYVAAYQSAPLVSGGSVNVGAGPSGSYRVNGDATFQGGIGSNHQKVFLVNGNVTVNNNITYPANFNAADGIPSLVLIATGNIYVSGNVTQMDGIFITRGTFYTCWPKVEPATVDTCNQRLTVNGSVMANNVDLFRTAGADGSTPVTQKAPAELFNLSPEVFLGNALNQTNQATVTTNQVRELPPRF